MYEAIATRLQRKDEKAARRFAIAVLRLHSPLLRLWAWSRAQAATGLPAQSMGLAPANPVGLAAGFDKDGSLVPLLEGLGFGFIEVGTVTPLPEPGNNPGIPVLLSNLYRINKSVAQPSNRALPRIASCLGISIGVNTRTPPDKAVDDLCAGLRAVWNSADYIAINLSTPRMRVLHEEWNKHLLHGLLCQLKEEQALLAARFGRHVPLAVKVALDLAGPALPTAIGLVRKLGFEALIAAADHTRQTAHILPQTLRLLRDQWTRRVADALEGQVSLIAVGGIVTVEDVRERTAVGASLVQVYSGLVQRGPWAVRAMIRVVQDAGEP